MITHHRTLYVKTENGGRSRWFPIFWACTECKSLNHIILPCYRLATVPAETPSALVNGVVEVLKTSPLDTSELLAELRRRRDQDVRHVFNSEVGMAIEYLKSRGVVAEETVDRTASTIEALNAKPWKSKHLGPCPAELKQGVVTKSLVSLYAQRLVPIARGGQEPIASRMQLGPVGVLCLHCQYCDIHREELVK
jgi:hypothetical protein